MNSHGKKQEANLEFCPKNKKLFLLAKSKNYFVKPRNNLKGEKLKGKWF